MIIHTERFGSIECDEKDILALHRGLLGFPGLKRFLLISHQEDSLFNWLQSVDDPAVAFVVVDPLPFASDYPLGELAGMVGAQVDGDLAVASIATITPDPRDITINLLAPIAFDKRTRVGGQFVLHESSYSSNHPLLVDSTDGNERETPDEGR